MEKSRKAECIQAEWDAKKELVEYLTTEYSCADLYELSAKAEAEILNLIATIDPQERLCIVVDNINNFFFNVHQLLDYAKPLEEEKV